MTMPSTKIFRARSSACVIGIVLVGLVFFSELYVCMTIVEMAPKGVNSHEEEAGKLEDRRTTRNTAVAAAAAAGGGGGRRPPLGQPRPFRFLFGIFAIDSPKDRSRRQAIRETYLSYYRHCRHFDRKRKMTYASGCNKDDDDDDDAENPIICSLSELQSNTTLQNNPWACQFVYAFVLGGNPSGPTEFFWDKHADIPNHSSSSQGSRKASDNVIVQTMDVLSFYAAFEYEHHKDIVLLNVKENQHKGKVPTWYAYVSALVQEKPWLQIDFVGKLDSDTLVKPWEFREWIELNHRLLNQTYVLGGWLIPCNKYCNFTNMKAPLFMPGGFTFVSMSVATYVTLNLTMEQKQSLTLNGPVEDIDWTNRVYSLENQSTHPKITAVNLGWVGRECGYHINMKNPVDMRKKYEELFLEEMQK